MLILLSNDDGVNAPGILALQEGLSGIAEVVVVAPESEQSAVGHAITIADPIRVKDISDGGIKRYSVDSTPADCVKIGVRALLGGRKPDLVVSGINQGGNYATNIIYSGTVSAATEGTVLGIRSIAFSMDSWTDSDFSRATKEALRLVEAMKDKELPDNPLINVNIPAPDVALKGTKVCHQSDRRFQCSFEKRHDPRGMDYYWQGGYMDLEDPDGESDLSLLKEGYTTVTPIHYDLTNYSFLESVKEWEL